MNPNKLTLIRSDQGDGGWSLHEAGKEDDDGLPLKILLSGEAEWIDDVGHWSRPSTDEWNAAYAMINTGN